MMSVDDDAGRNQPERPDASIPLRDRFAAFRAARPLPPSTGEPADKRFSTICPVVRLGNSPRHPEA